MTVFFRILWMFFCTGLLVIALPAQARTIYINDNLRVGVRAEPSTQVAPFSVVVTGMRLEVLDEQPGYLKIRTPKGETGWIREIYVSEQPPAVMRIETLKTRYRELEQQYREQGENIKILESANLALNDKIDALKQERSRWQLEKARSEYQRSGHGFWWWISLAGLLLAAASFTSGVLWHRQQAMKRLGGLRV